MTSKLPVRVSDRIAGWMEKAIVKHAAGDQVLYDVGMQMLGQGVFVHCFMISTQGALLGSWDTLALPLTDAHLATEAGVDGLVVNALEALREKRSNDLSAQLGALGGGS